MKAPLARTHYCAQTDTWKVLVDVQCGNVSPEIVAREIERFLSRVGIHHLSSDPLVTKFCSLERIEKGPLR